VSGQSGKKEYLLARVAERFVELLESADEVSGHLPVAMRTLLAEGGVNAEKILGALTEVDGDPAS
jgi:hypothetical protein